MRPWSDRNGSVSSRSNRAKPWSRTKARKLDVSVDEQWAEGLSNTLVGSSHPFQRDALEDEHRRIAIRAGRGGGKTSIYRARAVRKMARKRNARIIYLALSRPNAKDLNWEPLKELIHKLGQWDEFEFSESTLTCRCKRTGSTYRMVGADDRKELEKLRGQPFDEVQIDEAGSWDPELLDWLIDRIVGPRLGERNGCIVVGGSPGHILAGPFYDATRPGSAKHRPYRDRKKREYKGWTSWSSHFWNLRLVNELPNAKKLYPALVALWAEALIVKKDKGWSDDHPIWRREYEGEWAADNTENVFKYKPHDDKGAPWNVWDPHGGKRLEGELGLRAALAALPKDLGTFHFVLAGDKGSSDPFALNVFAFAPGDALQRIWHVYWFERTKMYAKPIAEILLGDKRDTDKPGGVFGLVGWPDGAVFDADQAFLDELANVYGIGATKAEKKADYKVGAIELVNGDLIDGRILILANSPLEEQIRLLQWKVDEYGRVKEDKAQANHSTDCLVYGRLLIAHLFETGAVTADRPAAAAGDPAPEPYEPRERAEDLNSLLAEPDFDDSWSTL